MDYGEPMGDFDAVSKQTREPSRAAVCYEELYPTLLNKAVLLFYLVIKNHPLENGNKRI